MIHFRFIWRHGNRGSQRGNAACMHRNCNPSWLRWDVGEGAGDQASLDARRQKLADMLEFVTTMSRWHDEMTSVPNPALTALIKMGSGVTKLINWRPGKKND